MLAKTEVYLCNHSGALRPEEKAAQESKAKDKAMHKRMSEAKQLLMELMGMVPVQHMDDGQEEDDSDDEERRTEEAAAKKIADDRRRSPSPSPAPAPSPSPSPLP